MSRLREPPVLLFVAHRLDDGVVAGWRALLDDCAGRGFRPVLTYDDSRGDFIESAALGGGERFLFTQSGLATRFPFRVYDPHRPLDQGNATFPILAYAHADPRPPFIWRIEYDVLYDGDWTEFFAAVADREADLLTTTLYDPVVRPDWGWWPTLAKPRLALRRLRRLRAFMPIARLSRRACTVLDRAYAKGWRGHDEAAVPTILASHGLRVEDLGGSGAWTPAGDVDRFYTNTPAARGLAPGTFVCPPHAPTREARSGLLYHPVKDRCAWAERSSPTPAHAAQCREG